MTGNSIGLDPTPKRIHIAEVRRRIYWLTAIFWWIPPRSEFIVAK